MSNPDPSPIPRIRLSDPKPLPYQAPQLETWPRPPHVGMILVQNPEKNYRLGVWTADEWAALDPIDREAMQRDVSSLSGLGQFMLRPIPGALYLDTVREVHGMVIVEEDREPAPPAGRAQSTPLPFRWEGEEEDDDEDNDNDEGDDEDEDEDGADDAPTGALTPRRTSAPPDPAEVRTLLEQWSARQARLDAAYAADDAAQAAADEADAAATAIFQEQTACERELVALALGAFGIDPEKIDRTESDVILVIGGRPFRVTGPSRTREAPWHCDPIPPGHYLVLE